MFNIVVKVTDSLGGRHAHMHTNVADKSDFKKNVNTWFKNG